MKGTNAAEIRGPRDSFRIPAEHYLDFSEEHWIPLPKNGEWLDLNRIVADPNTGVLLASLTGAHKGVQLVGMRSLLRYIAQCAAGKIQADSHNG